MKRWKVAILGTGAIAALMADTLNRMPEAQLYAVGSRDEARARDFAAAHGAERAYGSYEELVADPQVELVDIASPHSEPMLASIQAELRSGIIGEPRMLTGNLGYSIADVPRLRSPELAGGALLDVGVYPLNFALALFGHGYDRVESSCSKLPTGVDAQNAVTLYYTDGRMAQLNSSLEACLDRRGAVHGTKGYMLVENINNFESLSVYNGQHQLLRRVERPDQITGYEYEVRACLRALEKGELSCPEMPHEESLRVMELMDRLRIAWGIRYPFE